MSDSPGQFRDLHFQACQNNTVIFYVWSTTTVIFFTVGFTTSFAIIWLLVNRLTRGRTLSPNSVFVLNISIMDFLFFLIVPLGLINSLFLHNWTLDALMCSSFSLSMTGRPLVMVCICLDCYMATIHPFTYSQRKSLTPRIIALAVVWLVTLASMISCFVSARKNVLDSNDVILPIATLIIFFCDSFIISALVKSEVGKKGIHAQKRRAIHTVVISLVVSATSYTPPLIMSSIQHQLIHDFQVCILNFLKVTSFTSGSAIMPALWLHYYRQYTLLHKAKPAV